MPKLNRKEQILQASLGLFAEHGYHNTGMEHIAQAVGMRASSLYNHFKSKQEVIAAISIGTMEDLLRTHARSLAGISDPLEKLRMSMKVHAIFHAERAEEIQVCDQEINNLEEPHRSIVLQLRRDYSSRWVNTIREISQSGAFDIPDPTITAFALIDMGRGPARWYRPDGKYSIAELAEQMADMAQKLVTKESR